VSDRARDQVQRMLALVPYLQDQGGVPVEQVAKDFGVDQQTIVNDLNVLWFCGLPEAVTGDMIDVDMEALDTDGVVRLDNAEYLRRPLRLTAREALALIVALRTLRETVHPGAGDAVDRALAKLESAAGDATAAVGQVQVQVLNAGPVDEQVRGAVQDALLRRRRMRLVYLVPSRDETTERDVDPMRVFTAQGHSYLEAWCHRAEDVRLFRLDRVVGAEVLEHESTPPEQASPRDLSAGLFQPGDDDLVAVLDLAPAARWIAEYHPVESSQERPEGHLEVRMRVGNEDWLRRLVLRGSGDVAVLEPVRLAAQVRDRARTALAAYSSG